MAFLAQNFGFDVSKYQYPINFQKMHEYGAKFVIIRCGNGTTKDPHFDTYMQTAPTYFTALSVYHYYEPDRDPIQQANLVITTLAPYKAHLRRVWLDFEFDWEGTYKYPASWKVYRDRIRAAGYKTGIYTRASWWDSRVGTYANEFATDPLWAAQYNTVLNLIPKGWKEMLVPAMLWQNGTPFIGPQAGVTSLEIDHDLWNDYYDFEAEWGIPVVPPSISIDLNQGAARYEKGTLLAPRKIIYHLMEINLNKVELVVVPPNASGRLNRMTILEFMERFNCDAAINADEPYPYNSAETVLIRRAMSQGVKYGKQDDGATISFSPNQKMSVSWSGYTPDAYNAISGSKLLLSAGSIPFFLNDLPPDPRTIVGWKDDKLYWLVVDGRGDSQGVTLLEAATLIQGFGAAFATNEDGGGSSAMAIRGMGIMNQPSDGILRDVGHYIGIRFNGGSMLGSAKEKLGYTSKIRNAPKAGGTEIGLIGPYQVISFYDHQVADLDFPTDARYKWFDLGPIDPNNPSAGRKYTPYLRPSEGERFTITIFPTPDPEPASTIKMDVTMYDFPSVGDKYEAKGIIFTKVV